jgi:hypothetical protein
LSSASHTRAEVTPIQGRAAKNRGPVRNFNMGPYIPRKIKEMNNYIVCIFLL